MSQSMSRRPILQARSSSAMRQAAPIRSGYAQAAGQSIDVAAADLANTRYMGGANAGTERVWVRANDGIEWGAWKPWNMTTALNVPNAAPVVTAASPQTVLLDQSADAASLFSVSDADNDPITQYEFWDS